MQWERSVVPPALPPRPCLPEKVRIYPICSSTTFLDTQRNAHAAGECNSWSSASQNAVALLEFVLEVYWLDTWGPTALWACHNHARDPSSAISSHEHRVRSTPHTLQGHNTQTLASQWFNMNRTWTLHQTAEWRVCELKPHTKIHTQQEQPSVAQRLYSNEGNF